MTEFVENDELLQVYVDCDKNCRALLEPITFDDYVKALDHWKNHSFIEGCAHGC